MTMDAATRLRLRLSLSLSDVGTVVEMSVNGDFDEVEIDRFDRAARVIPDDVVETVVDLTETTVIDSAALGALIRLRQAVERRGGELTVLVHRPFQQTVMRVGGLWDYLGVHVVDHDGTNDRFGTTT